MFISRKQVVMPLVIAAASAAGAIYAYFAGEDINWDWQNYHDYAGFALLHGRFDVDVMSGGFQSFLNPLVHVLPYLLRHGLAAPWWGVALGALHGLNLALVCWVTRVMLEKDARVPALLAAVLIAACGPMTLSEVGTSFADILTAMPILAGVALIFADSEQDGRRILLAGLLIGAATGLKLTNATFLIGAGVCLLLAPRPLVAMLHFGAGSAVGGLATGGAWALKMWRDFGSPLFPFYNAIFRSREAPPVSIIDTRFMPRGLIEAFAYPFDWLVGRHPSSEWPFRDPRFAVVVVLLLATIAVGAWRRREFLQARDRQFLLLFWVSYALWMLAFSIQRYLIPLELLSAPLIVLLLTRLAAAGRPSLSFEQGAALRACHLLTMTAAFAIALWSQPTDWMRRPWSDPYRPQLAAALQKPATFLLLHKPLGYIVSQLPAGSRAYQLSEIVLPLVPGGVLERRVRAGLAEPLPGGIWALYFATSPTDNPPRLAALDAYGLERDPGRACERIAAVDGSDIEACPVISRASSASAAELDRTGRDSN